MASKPLQTSKKKSSEFYNETLKFLRVNLWVEKYRMHALGAWFWVDALYNVWTKIYPLFTIYLGGQIINSILLYTTTSNKDLSPITLNLSITILLALFDSNLRTYYWNNMWIRGNYMFRVHLFQGVYKKLAELNWDHIENPTTEKT